MERRSFIKLLAGATAAILLPTEEELRRFWPGAAFEPALVEVASPFGPLVTLDEALRRTYQPAILRSVRSDAEFLKHLDAVYRPPVPMWGAYVEGNGLLVAP